MNFAQLIEWGPVMAGLGAALAAGFACSGSAIGAGVAGEAGSGVVATNPERFGSVMLLQALPCTQGIYGLLIAFLISSKAGLFGGDVCTATEGFRLLCAGIPIAVGGYKSAIAQGKTAAAGICMIAKRPEEQGKAMIMTVMVETFAVLSLLVSFLLYNGVA